MEYSKNFNFALPSRDNDVDPADINEISNNFRKIDENSVIKEVGKGLSTNDFTNEEKERLANALLPENIDQTYSSGSKNAQSGIAVKEAIKTVIDAEMSDTSENTVQNKVVKRYIDEGHTVKLVRLLILDTAEQGLYYTDSIGYQGSGLTFSDFRFILYSKGVNDRKDVIVISSEGIKRLNLLNMKMEPIYNYTIIDDVLSDISNNAIANKVVTQALSQQEIDLKNYADSLKVTVDSEMSDTSENPVQNKVVKKYVDDKIKYRIINDITITEDISAFLTSQDDNGNAFDLQKFFFLFIGKFDAALSNKPLSLSVKKGVQYLMYNSFTVTADTECGFWLSADTFLRTNSLVGIQSEYSNALLKNFSNGIAQGLIANNRAVNSDVSLVPVTSISPAAISELRFMVHDQTIKMKAGSRFILLGIDYKD